MCVRKSALLHQRGFFFLACVRLFKATAARIEEGRAFYLGHVGVNTEYHHRPVRRSSAVGSSGQQMTQEQWEMLRETEEI